MKVRIKSIQSAATWFSLLTIGTTAAVTILIYGALYLLHAIPSEGDIVRWLPVIAIGVCLLLGTLFTVIWAKDVLRPFTKLIAAMNAISAGDFSVRLDTSKAHGEYARLMENFNKMAEELGSVETLKESFINDFSHEFKTPVVSIRGFARQLKNPDLTPEQREEYLDIILSESERLANMSTNILLLSKFENLEIIPDCKPYALDEQIRHCVSLFDRVLAEKNLLPDGDLEEITYCGNESIMEHVWINLLSNAFKFAPEGSTVRITLHRTGTAIEASFADEGPGMDEQTVARLFEKFYCADPSRHPEGNGLGLPLVRRIVDLCGGTVTVRSETGQGSVFTVRLPDKF